MMASRMALAIWAERSGLLGSIFICQTIKRLTYDWQDLSRVVNEDVPTLDVDQIQRCGALCGLACVLWRDFDGMGSNVHDGPHVWR